MCDLMITDAAVLLPDGTVQSGQTIEVKDGKIYSIRPFRDSDMPGAAENQISGKGKTGHARTGGLPYAYRTAAF